ncbi:MAG: TRAP transporter small permease subunit [Gammaproteobacteria bacterium]|nr:TRAP transporter small permease subunit [Gammaproteobacteria bacterium]MDH3506140.1 TRAP transporter small permease subunit [Gammaproteobacteria bacterium]
MLKLRDQLERFGELTGAVIAWLTILMVLGTFIVVVLRYAFDLGWISMQESITWMHAAVFMLGAAYTLKQDEHVRVDIFYRRMQHKRRALVDLIGTLVFLLPVSIFLAMSSWDYVVTSWVIQESSREAGGLPYPFVPILKSLIPATAALLIIQAVANLITAALVITGRIPGEPEHDVPQGEVL